MTKIAIIGSGPSGIITLDSLLKEGFTDITVFERRNEVGGTWNLYPPEKINFEDLSTGKIPVDPIPDTLPAKVKHTNTQRFLDSATYSYLETNVSAHSMQFSQPFPTESISKHGKDSVFKHYTQIKQYLEDLTDTKYVTLGTSVEKVSKTNDGKWRLVLRKFGDEFDYIYEEVFDKVVVASGHFDVPFIPEIPGLSEFANSNFAIHSKQFRSRDDFKDKTVIVVGASISAMDGVRDLLKVAKKVISSQKATSGPHVYFGTEAFDHPDIDKRGQIVKIEKNTFYFDDGTNVNADALLLATGFLYHYPFLDQVPELLELIFSAEDPSLAFVGHNTPGLTFKLFQWQAVLVARVFSGKGKLPSAIRTDPTIHPDFKGYYEELRECSNGGLPEWDQSWEDAFYSGHLKRRQYWIDNP
ncbi:FMOGS-OX3 Flavin-containing monooxygenase FMO GS-OX3 [Candida maltosa Xu316]|uniref:Flavin-containing monooxygenase, putative n=1 Tax=Candida maltosa (strain Xu316) TaxID=1245528 RepID=M3J1Z5_CANMX|nr:Flavin-containing monooxygenase, putative [Candida maltosa Xu316]